FGIQRPPILAACQQLVLLCQLQQGTEQGGGWCAGRGQQGKQGIYRFVIAFTLFIEKLCRISRQQSVQQWVSFIRQLLYGACLGQGRRTFLDVLHPFTELQFGGNVQTYGLRSRNPLIFQILQRLATRLLHEQGSETRLAYFGDQPTLAVIQGEISGN